MTTKCVTCGHDVETAKFKVFFTKKLQASIVIEAAGREEAEKMAQEYVAKISDKEAEVARDWSVGMATQCE